MNLLNVKRFSKNISKNIANNFTLILLILILGLILFLIVKQSRKEGFQQNIKKKAEASTTTLHPELLQYQEIQRANAVAAVAGRVNTSDSHLWGDEIKKHKMSEGSHNKNTYRESVADTLLSASGPFKTNKYNNEYVTCGLNPPSIQGATGKTGCDGARFFLRGGVGRPSPWHCKGGNNQNQYPWYKNCCEFVNNKCVNKYEGPLADWEIEAIPRDSNGNSTAVFFDGEHPNTQLRKCYERNRFVGPISKQLCSRCTEDGNACEVDGCDNKSGMIRSRSEPWKCIPERNLNNDEYCTWNSQCNSNKCNPDLIERGKNGEIYKKCKNVCNRWRGTGKCSGCKDEGCCNLYYVNKDGKKSNCVWNGTVCGDDTKNCSV